MHPYDDIGDASSSLRGSTSSLYYFVKGMLFSDEQEGEEVGKGDPVVAGEVAQEPGSAAGHGHREATNAEGNGKTKQTKHKTASTRQETRR